MPLSVAHGRKTHHHATSDATLQDPLAQIREIFEPGIDSNLTQRLGREEVVQTRPSLLP